MAFLKKFLYEDEEQEVEQLEKQQVQIVLFEPRSFDEGEQIVRTITQKKACVVSLKKLHSSNAQRLVDLLTGASLAVNGMIKKIASGTILVSPPDINVNGDINLSTQQV